jgi:two-component system, cell cycle sensor histidine kinase and response regulator CckA
MEESLKVLLVEDSEEDAELVALALRRGGYDVSMKRVDTRPAMEEALGSGDWDVVVADYAMPQFTLSEALKMVREKELDVPFLIVSASIIEDAAIQAMREGAHDFIMKDKLARLVPAVERELREAGLRRERKHLEEHVRQSQKMESLGVLAGGVAHDFNNLLVGIMGNASLAIDMLPESSPIVPLLDDVVLASQKAADLTRQMLAYAGKGRFVSEPTDLSSLVQDIAGLVSTSISKKVSLCLNLEPNLPLIEADPTQVQQLIMNLLINGAEAIGDRQGVVTVTTGLRSIEPGAATLHFGAESLEAGPYVFLEVIDNGCGMDHATKSKIFEPFFTTKFTGRGLGLAAAMGIVRGHKGALKVDSRPGEGSTFEILFPALSSGTLRRQPSSRETVARRAHQGRGHILVVDDEEVVRRAAMNALERYGYTVLLSENGQRAVDIFTGLSDQIALVLLDLTMPVMGGEEAFHRLRAIRPDVEIILTSGYDQSQALAGFAGQEVSAFMQKPYTGDELAEAVRSILGGRAAAV